MNIKIRKKAKIRNRYNQAAHLAQDSIWESKKKLMKHHIKESKEVSPSTLGDHKASLNRQENMTNTKHKITNMFNKRSTALEQSIKHK